MVKSITQLCFLLYAHYESGEFVTFYSRFEQLCKAKGVTPTQAARDNKIAQSVVSMWKTRGSTPKAATVQKLADYFGVTVNQLLGLDALIDPDTERINAKMTKAIKKHLESGWGSREDFAKFVNVPIETTYKWENGEEVPTYSELLKIAQAYNEDIESFLGTSYDEILENLENEYCTKVACDAGCRVTHDGNTEILIIVDGIGYIISPEDFENFKIQIKEYSRYAAYQLTKKAKMKVPEHQKKDEPGQK